MIPDESTPTASAHIARRLLTLVASIAEDRLDLAQRRKALLQALVDLIAADAGWWSWGRGWPDSSAVAPVAIIDHGFTDQQRALVIEWALDPDTDKNFRQPILARMAGKNATVQVRREIVPDEIWKEQPYMRRQLATAGFETWLMAVRYSATDTWSNIFFVRKLGREEFGNDQKAIIDLAMTSVTWLHATPDEYLPAETFVGLTPRQRTVMLLLLDGLPRKQIAKRLAIGEETVGDHIKSIYKHFNVNSASELAALFLRGR
jgi:DNA-binding CsgD family transcriptional regulator